MALPPASLVRRARTPDQLLGRPAASSSGLRALRPGVSRVRAFAQIASSSAVPRLCPECWSGRPRPLRAGDRSPIQLGSRRRSVRTDTGCSTRTSRIEWVSSASAVLRSNTCRRLARLAPIRVRDVDLRRGSRWSRRLPGGCARGWPTVGRDGFPASAVADDQISPNAEEDQ